MSTAAAISMGFVAGVGISAILYLVLCLFAHFKQVGEGMDMIRAAVEELNAKAAAEKKEAKTAGENLTKGDKSNASKEKSSN